MGSGTTGTGHMTCEEVEEEVVVVVFTLENRGGSAQHATRATPTRWEEEEVLFIRDSITNFIVQGYPRIFWISNAAPSQ